MELREKAILGLECCLETIDDESCPEICPYYSECMKYEKRCIFQYVMKDALSVLKAQEPKFVSDIAEAIIGCKPKVKVGHCPSCGVLMSETDRYCRKCGQAVKWDEPPKEG